jgi:hypothetical protein
MSNSQPAKKDYLLAAIGGLLVLLAIGSAGGLLWSLVVDGDSSGLVLSPIVIAVYVLLARSAWQRTVWTRHPIAGVTLRPRDRNRRLSHREVVMTRVLLIAGPTLAIIGALASWWDWTFPSIMVFTLGFQLILAPRHHRRQVLIGPS